jgi:hypothetical protein
MRLLIAWLTTFWHALITALFSAILPTRIVA